MRVPHLSPSAVPAVASETPPAAGAAPDCAPRADRIERLERELAERNDLLAIAGHELRNPLHALSLQLTLARSSAQAHGDGETLARLQKAQHMLQRYSNRVTLLLDLVRNDHAGYPASQQRIELATLLSGVADGLQQEARFRGVTLDTDLAGPCHVVADPLLVEQVVDNLLINAFKHAACSEVRVVLHPAGDGEVRIEIVDNGRGIAPEDQARVFGKFGVAQASPRGTGTGLGLWIVQRLASTLGGSVSLQSTPGEGAAFTLRLPLPASTES